MIRVICRGQGEEERLRTGLLTHAVERRRQLRAPRSVNDGNGFPFFVNFTMRATGLVEAFWR